MSSGDGTSFVPAELRELKVGNEKRRFSEVCKRAQFHRFEVNLRTIGLPILAMLPYGLFVGAIHLGWKEMTKTRSGISLAAMGLVLLGIAIGYTLANDVSARDIQLKAFTGQEFTLTHAKGLDGFKPLGPALVTADEFEDPIDIQIEARVNGELRQDARTSDFVHPLSRCIAYVSRYMRLDPGDVILTGSPAGVGFFRGIFLKAGDVVEMRADRIGTLRNRVIDAPLPV